MGHKDIERIHPVYRACVDFCKLANISLKFKEDTGDYDTALEFIENIAHHPPISNTWKNIVLVPDILVLSDDKPIAVIEYEEVTGNRKTGAKMAKKGHGHEGDLDTKRDVKRNQYYRDADIRLFRVWQSDANYKPKLFRFILDLLNTEKNQSLQNKVTVNQGISESDVDIFIKYVKCKKCLSDFNKSPTSKCPHCNGYDFEEFDLHLYKVKEGEYDIVED